MLIFRFFTEELNRMQKMKSENFITYGFKPINQLYENCPNRP